MKKSTKMPFFDFFRRFFYLYASYLEITLLTKFLGLLADYYKKDKYAELEF